VFTDEGKADLNLDSPLLEKRLLMERLKKNEPKF
jgi:hypothetical protein